MKIAHYLNHTNKANGHVAVAVDLACEQASVGHDVYMVTGPGDFDDCLERHGVTIVRLADATGPTRLIRMAADLLPAMRRVRPDVVNAHMVASAVAARMVRPFAGYRLVTTVHNSFDRQAALMRVGDRVIAVSEAVNAQMRQKGVAASKLRTVTNGTVGGARRPLLPAIRRPLRHPAIVTVAGLHPRKGIGHLIDAFATVHADHPDANLYLVGDGPCREMYETQARATPSSAAIHFLGHLDDPREVLATAEIFVLASLHDPFPLVLCEARQMGNAIIGTNVDGIPESLGFGKRGVLVPPADPAALAAAIAGLLDDPARQRQLAQAAAADNDEITVASMSARTVAVYREAIG